VIGSNDLAVSAETTTSMSSSSRASAMVIFLGCSARSGSGTSEKPTSNSKTFPASVFLGASSRGKALKGSPCAGASSAAAMLSEIVAAVDNFCSRPSMAFVVDLRPLPPKISFSN
jgi:hypothetical protein